MNVFEKLINELDWDKASLQIQEEELKYVLAMPEDEALSYSIAYMQRLYVCALPYREMDEENKWATYWMDKHRAFRNALINFSDNFDAKYYDEWCWKLPYPNEFKVQL